MIRADSATIKLDTAWSEYLDPFRDLAGGALTLCVIVAVAAIVIWVIVGTGQKFAHLRSDGFTRVLGVIFAAALVGSLVSGVAWGSNLVSSMSVEIDDEPSGIDLGDLPPQ